MIKACIFDLEGVIINDESYFSMAMEAIATAYGIDGKRYLRDFSRNSERRAALHQLALALGNDTPEMVRQLAQQVEEHIFSHLAEMTPDDIPDGVFVFLKQLLNKGISMAVVSAHPHAREILNRLRITHYFYAVVEEEQTSWQEASAKTYLSAAERLGVKPTRTLVFENTPDGVAAAQLAGFYVVGVGNRDELGAANEVIPNFEEIKFQHLLTGLGVQ